MSELTGRVLDAAVADFMGTMDQHRSSVFGSGRIDSSGVYTESSCRSCGQTVDCSKLSWWTQVCRASAPNYSSDISAGMLVVEKLLLLGYDFDLMAEGDERVVCVMNPKMDQFWARSTSLAEAICRAALTAVGDQKQAQVSIEPKQERESVIGDDGGSHVSWGEPCATVVR